MNWSHANMGSGETQWIQLCPCRQRGGVECALRLKSLSQLLMVAINPSLTKSDKK